MTERPIAFITGGSRGIGKAISLALARDGYDIWINYKNKTEQAEEVLKGVSNLGCNCKLVQLDLSRVEDIYDCITKLIKYESPEVFVHNAGILEVGPISFINASQIKNTFAVNLESFFHLVKILSRKMIQARKGRIISISSIAGLKGIPRLACYSASKAGLIAATYSLAQELGPHGIYVNTIMPGLIETQMSQSFKDAILGSIPMGRAGKPEEVADLVSFLCSNKASYINGSIIPITGGLSL